MTKQQKDFPADLGRIDPPLFPDHIVSITDHGAVCDGQTPNTQAFKQAIDKCAADGGGTVKVPPGCWLTGPIRLRSNICLHLDAGAVVLFSTRPADYLPVVFTRWEGIEAYNYSPLIYARDCTNIAISGEGLFDGQGQAWWRWKQTQYVAAKALYDAEHNSIPVENRIFGMEDALRPQFFQPLQCTRVLIEGVTFKDGPMWTIHPVYCRDLIIRNVTVLTDGPNTDGLNPDSCCNVLVEGCRFSTGDDCIAINSGMNEDGWRVNKPCENVLVRHCRMEKGHGGIVIGSAMSGGVRNIYAHDCRCEGTDIGIRLKSRRGRGGTVEGVHVERFTMTDIRNDAVRIDMFYAAGTVLPRSDHPPTFRNIHIRDISCQGAQQAVVLRGLPERLLENISLENLNIYSDRGVTCDHVDGLYIKNASFDTEYHPALVLGNIRNLKTESIRTTSRNYEEIVS